MFLFVSIIILLFVLIAKHNFLLYIFLLFLYNLVLILAFFLVNIFLYFHKYYLQK